MATPALAVTTPVRVQRREHVPLAELTTLGVGGAARYWQSYANEDELREALGFAGQHGLPVFVLGGGSNLLVADQGFEGLVIQCVDQTIEWLTESGGVRLRAGAGAEWDDLVAESVARGLGGIECLSGIPGLVGAAPIQNIGAYGQEAAETLEVVTVVERSSGQASRILAADCGFGYRTSRFKTEWLDRFIITGIELRLTPTDQCAVRYPELRRHLGGAETCDPKALRQAVLAVRRSKSMVLDSSDPNGRSAGSFFVNPLVDLLLADEVQRRAQQRGTQREMPRFPSADGRVKLSAAWLIEEAGFRRGHQAGRAGLSSKHTLALINRGGASANEIIALAAQIRRLVADVFGVELTPEPRFLGFSRPALELLDSLGEE